MNNPEFAKLFEERTKKFAIDIILFSRLIPNNSDGKVIKNQIIKFGTSVGANDSENNRGSSKVEFMSCIKISQSEASETCYWLEIIREVFDVDIKKFDKKYRESNELLALFTSISKGHNS